MDGPLLARESGGGRPRVLIVRPSALGDVARTVPALASLRRHWPEAHIDWLVGEAFADVIRHHPMLDGVVNFRRDLLAGCGLRPRATREGWGLLRQLSRGRYDRVYDLQGLFRSGLLSWLSGAPRRVGFADAREGGWFGCNVRHRVEARHTVDRMLGLLRAEGIEPVADMRLYVGGEDEAWFQRWAVEAGLEPGGYACVAPTARWRCKCWPVERYAELVGRLLEAGVSRVVVLAGPGERKQVQPLLAGLSEAQRGRVHLPRTRVGQMMAVLGHARLLVCNDSAALHVAVGLGLPAVAIFGPTDPAQVGPYSDEAAVIRPAAAADVRFNYRRHGHDDSLIRQVGVEEVWSQVARRLQPPQARAAS